jgi:hypothetical protein
MDSNSWEIVGEENFGEEVNEKFSDQNSRYGQNVKKYE